MVRNLAVPSLAPAQVTNKLLTAMPPDVLPVLMTFSARTSANQTQDILDGRTEKRRKGVFGPPAGKRCACRLAGLLLQTTAAVQLIVALAARWQHKLAVDGVGLLSPPACRPAACPCLRPIARHVVFVDDLNMPQREKYFAQPPLELLRQWMDHGGWYERRPPCAFRWGPAGAPPEPSLLVALLAFLQQRGQPAANPSNVDVAARRQIVDTVFVGGMGPPGGGRNPVSSRLLRHFNIVSFTDMSNESLTRIFSTILGAFLSRGMGEALQQMTGGLVRCPGSPGDLGSCLALVSDRCVSAGLLIAAGVGIS